MRQGPTVTAASRHPFARLSDVRPYETADHRAANFAGRAGARCVSTTRFDSIEPQSAQSESTNVLSATGAGRLPTAEMPIELGICTTTAATVDRPNTLIAMPANHLCRCGDLKTTLRTFSFLSVCSVGNSAVRAVLRMGQRTWRCVARIPYRALNCILFTMTSSVCALAYRPISWSE